MKVQVTTTLTPAGFFSELVVEGLVDFQSKVSQVMKTIGLAFNDLGLLQFS